MSMLYWGRGREDFGGCLESHCAGFSSSDEMLEEASVGDLQLRLAAERAELRLVVLVPASVAELTELLALNPLLSGIPVILLLPSDDNEALALAHRFHPRFVSCADGALADAAAVAANILKNQAEFD